MRDTSGHSASAVLRLDGVSAGYGSVPAIRDIDLYVDREEVVVLLGANGAGKTTTLSTIAGEIPARTGRMTWNDEPLEGSTVARIRRGMAYVTEERTVFMGLSVEHNLRLGAGSVADALAVFPELEPLLRRRVGLLSGGEQQMLGLARALASKPALLLADELSLGLAPLVVERLMAAVRAAANAGAAVLLVEQQVRRALGVADRGYVLERGRMALEGSGADLLTRSAEIERSYLDAPSLT